jgi:nucleotide-binding universal stress UspA family protein
VTEPWVEVLSGEAVLVHPEEEYQAEMTTRAAHALGVVAERAATLGVHCDTIHVRDQHPAEGILAAAKDRGCDLSVMASYGRRGLQRLMFGSQTHRVLTNTTLPVLVCR